MDPMKEISCLDPSRNLLEFYRRKISEHDTVKEELYCLLERYKNLALPTQLAEEHNQLMNDLSELREALSDVNIFIHAERQQVAQLHLERERLQVDLAVAEKKIQLVCSITNITKEDLDVFIQNPKKKGILKQQIPPKYRQSELKDGKHKDYEASEREQALQKHLKLVENHMKESKTAWLEEKTAILDDRSIQQAEAKSQLKQEQLQLKLLAAKLEESQKLLQDTTQSAVDAKSEMLKSKRLWLAEKDKLLTDLKRQKHIAFIDTEEFEGIGRSRSYTNLANLTESCEVRHVRKEMRMLEKQFKEESELRDLYETKCRNIEREKCKLLEEKEAEKLLFKDKIRKCNEHKELLHKQNEKLDLRRKIQAEGFNTEFRLLQEDFRKILHLFYKLTNFYDRNKDMADDTKIKDLKAASSLARNIHHAIIDAKKKIMKLESSISEN